LLEILAHHAIPLVEVSGLALGQWRHGTFVVAVGDHGPDVAFAEVVDGTGPASLGEWQVVDLSDLDSPPGAPRVEQAEAIATDGDRQAIVLIEDPALLLLLDVPDRRLTRAYELDSGGLAGLEAWTDDAGSRGEGLILLKGGHVLVVKEKRPAGLIEFGPAGASPLGVSGPTMHPAGRRWEPPPGSSLSALAWWRADESLADISDAAVAPDGQLYLVSDQSNAIARLSLPLEAVPGSLAVMASVWALPETISKAEGLAFLTDGSAIIAVDRPDRGRNLAVLQPLSQWPDGHRGQ
jgi:hypothetical protein